MRETDFSAERASGFSWRDLLLILLCGSLVVLGLALLNIVEVQESKDTTVPPGNLSVLATWEQGQDWDVDLWLSGPGEGTAVGYSNKSGLLWDLLRDDLGARPDVTPLNFETAYTRGVKAGEYRVNLHCFRCPSTPVEVLIEIAINDGKAGKSGLRPLFNTKVTLKNGEEKTAARFKLTGDGKIEPDSLNSIFKPLRSAQ